MSAHPLVVAAEAAYRAAADPERAAPMAAYMRHRFAFLGIPRPRRAELDRALLGRRRLANRDAEDVTRALWELPEREFQYLGCVVAQRHARRAPEEFLPVLGDLITARSWWDTVDHLASRCVGPMVAAHPHLAGTMDAWAAGDDMWPARAAIIHQLTFGPRTDADRLFGYCVLRAADREFFIRKAIGWALRQYARTEPDAVRAFVAAHRDVLSPLSVREATRHLA